MEGFEFAPTPHDDVGANNPTQFDLEEGETSVRHDS